MSVNARVTVPLGARVSKKPVWPGEGEVAEWPSRRSFTRQVSPRTVSAQLAAARALPVARCHPRPATRSRPWSAALALARGDQDHLAPGARLADAASAPRPPRVCDGRGRRPAALWRPGPGRLVGRAVSRGPAAVSAARRGGRGDRGRPPDQDVGHARLAAPHRARRGRRLPVPHGLGPDLGAAQLAALLRGDTVGHGARSAGRSARPSTEGR